MPAQQLPAALLESWQFHAAQPASTAVMPDGCRDLIGLHNASGTRWFITPLANSVYSVRHTAADHFCGYRLRPGCLLDETALLRAASGRNLDWDAHAALEACARIDAGIAEALAVLSHGHTVRAAARSLGVTERSLQRHLLQATGRPPAWWRQLARARRAAQALPGSVPLAAIAADHGYADQAHFTRATHQWFGGTPAALRRDAHTLQAIISLSGY